MFKKRQAKACRFLFTAAAAGAVSAICNKKNTVSVGFVYFLLKGIELIELVPFELCKKLVFAQKNTSLYNVYILLQSLKTISRNILDKNTPTLIFLEQMFDFLPKNS